jgi:PiT family inorganic phosphate transporter
MGQKITKLPRWGVLRRDGGRDLDLLGHVPRHPGLHHAYHHRAIMGVGATISPSSVHWGVAGRIIWAWFLTIPASALVAAGFQYLFGLLGH